MAVKIIDLSDTLQNGTTEPLYHKIIYRDHEEGVGRQELFGLESN